MSKEKVKKVAKRVFDFINQKKVLVILTAILLIAVIAFTTVIRTNNMHLLKDATTDEYVTADLDAFYFLRLAEVLNEHGSYPEYDSMRYPSLKVPYSGELLPHTIVFMYKIMSKFSSEISLRYVNIIYPVIFFALGMLVFFFLILKLTNSRLTALLSSFFLAIIPAYLFRTMAGVSDHEPLGMFAFFLALLSFVIAMQKIEKKNSVKMAIVLGIVTGFFTIFNIVAWSGVAAFTLLIIPLTVLLLWITNKMNNEENRNNLKEYLLFYIFWFISFILLSFIFSYPLSSIAGLILSVKGIIVPFVLIFTLIDYLLLKSKNKKLKEIGKYRIIISVGLSIIFAIIISLMLNQSTGFSLSGIIQNILRPFGGGRVGETVAENAIPYTLDVMGQFGKLFFWLFIFGASIVGIEFSKGIDKKKNKTLFSLSWVLMVVGIFFHRYSTESILNGDSFISKLFYIGSIFLFFAVFVHIYFKDKIETKSENIIIILLVFFMTIAGISAVRLLFILSPVICFIGIYGVIKVYEYSKLVKDDIIKLVIYAALIGVLILLIFTSVNYIKIIKAQSVQIGSSANLQWQYSMEWVRENTNSEDIFVHWWDYGYWVQYLGERPTVTDGGHANLYWDHLIGRYLLTTPKPVTALSFMKSQNVSYLLIDPTDIGKYSAYSSIGSDEKNKDRFSFIPVMASNPSQTQETKNGTIRIYNGGYGIEDDIVYEKDGKKIFIPKEYSGIGGIILEKENGTFKQPNAVYIYNGNQISIPMRYVYYDGTLYDFEEGINSAAYIIPLLSQTELGVQLDNEGALIYLSPRVVDSLISKLYLMNDPNKEYRGVKLAHSEPDPLKTYLETYGGMKLNEFFYFSGLRGPLKIWKIDSPEDIRVLEEFSAVSGEYAGLDNMTFIK